VPLRRVNEWLDNGTGALAGLMPMAAARFVYARFKPARLPRRLQPTSTVRRLPVVSINVGHRRRRVIDGHTADGEHCVGR
jgi:hypothetical protein